MSTIIVIYHIKNYMKLCVFMIRNVLGREVLAYILTASEFLRVWKEIVILFYDKIFTFTRWRNNNNNANNINKQKKMHMLVGINYCTHGKRINKCACGYSHYITISNENKSSVIINCEFGREFVGKQLHHIHNNWLNWQHMTFIKLTWINTDWAVPF